MSYPLDDLVATISGDYARIRRLRWVGVALLIALLFAVPYVIQNFTWIDITMSILIFALAAVAFNVLLGYTGLLSFGHAAFFGGAAYAVALAMKYAGITEFFLLMPIGILAATVLSVVIGWISVRHTGTYYALLMLALAQMLFVVANQLSSITGGSTGIRVANPTVLGVDFVEQLGYLDYLSGIYYYLIVFIVVVSLVLLWALMKSSFGLTLRAIREDAQRAQSVGIPVKRFRWYATIVSGSFTGIAGVLFAFKAGHITPASALYWLVSGEIAIMAILGGIGAFLGPAAGAFIFLVIEKYATEFVGGYWMFVQGILLLAVVLYFQEGVIAGLKRTLTRALDLLPMTDRAPESTDMEENK